MIAHNANRPSATNTASITIIGQSILLTAPVPLLRNGHGKLSCALRNIQFTVTIRRVETQKAGPRSSANRRILCGAIVNCLSSPVIVQGNARNVPVAAFGKFFLVLPATKETNGNIYAELNGLVQPSDHLTVDSVELYR